MNSNESNLTLNQCGLTSRELRKEVIRLRSLALRLEKLADQLAGPVTSEHEQPEELSDEAEAEIKAEMEGYLRLEREEERRNREDDALFPCLSDYDNSDNSDDYDRIQDSFIDDVDEAEPLPPTSEDEIPF